MEKLLFLTSSLTHFWQTGSVWPSSTYLADAMIKSADLTNPRVVVELGAGTGAITASLLKKLPHTTKIIAFEINSSLREYLKASLPDTRLIVIPQSAELLAESLRALNIKCVDAVFSGLPLSQIKKTACQNIFRAVTRILSPDGAYIQFQYSLQNLGELKKEFETVTKTFEWRNFPPAFIYRCEPFKKHNQR